MKLTTITKCRECGSTSLTWDTAIRVMNGVQQNRLNTQDVKCVFFLGCDECSETLKIVDADKVAALLNASVEPSEPSGGKLVPLHRCAGCGNGQGFNIGHNSNEDQAYSIRCDTCHKEVRASEHGGLTEAWNAANPRPETNVSPAPEIQP